MKALKTLYSEIEQIIIDKIDMDCDCCPAKIVYQSVMAPQIVALMEKNGWKREESDHDN